MHHIWKFGWLRWNENGSLPDVFFNTLATWCEERTHWKEPWCWEKLKVGGEGDSRGQGGWMASPTQWTWVWVNSGSWWWTGRPGVLQSMGSQWTGHDWATELNFSEGIDSVFLYSLHTHTHTHTQNIPQCLFQNVFNKNDNTCYKSTQKARTKMILWIQYTERLPSHWSSNSIKSLGNKTV